MMAEAAKKANAPENFSKEMLGLAKAAGFKSLADQFSAIAEMAKRTGLKDLDACETEADRHELMEQFKTDFPHCIKTKLTKTKTAKAVKKGKKK